MAEPEPTSVLLIARAQAWFEAFVVPESLPQIDPQWIDQFSIPPQPGISARAWIGRGPLQHQLGNSVFLYFENGEEEYPLFTHPSTGPKGASLKAAKSDRLLTADERTAIFSVEVVAATPVPKGMFEQAHGGNFDDTNAQPLLSAAKAALDTVVGAFALYQFPLVWRPIAERNIYMLWTCRDQRQPGIANRSRRTTSSHSG